MRSYRVKTSGKRESNPFFKRRRRRIYCRAGSLFRSTTFVILLLRGVALLLLKIRKKQTDQHATTHTYRNPRDFHGRASSDILLLLLYIYARARINITNVISPRDERL